MPIEIKAEPVAEARQDMGLWPLLSIALGVIFGLWMIFFFPSSRLAVALGLTPDVYLTKEAALLDSSLKIHVENCSSKPMRHLAIIVNGKEPGMLFADRLAPGEKVTLGWLELGEGLQVGDTMKIKADGFLFSNSFMVK